MVTCNNFDLSSECGHGAMGCLTLGKGIFYAGDIYSGVVIPQLSSARYQNKPNMMTSEEY